MASYLPPYLTRVQQSTNAPSSSESISYDYSGLDEIRKRQDEANQLGIGRYQQLYGGDVAGSVGAGQRIRSLLSSLKDIEPVRVASYSSSQDMGGGSTEVSGEHDEPKEEKPAMQPTYDTRGVSGFKPPNKQTAKTRARVNNNILAGSPRIDPGMA
jgi:hypothetical protein